MPNEIVAARTAGLRTRAVPELSIVPLVIMPIGREPALAVLGGATMYLASSPCGRLNVLPMPEIP